MKGPSHRTHSGWLDLALFHPAVTVTMRETLRTVVEYGTWRDKRGNLYAYPRATMAKRLGMNERSVQLRLKAVRAAGWLVLCTRGQKGRQQTYHRSVPWDSMRYWTRHPCPVCGGIDPLFRESQYDSLNEDMDESKFMEMAADSSDAEFDSALKNARAEGDLSRTNVAKHLQFRESQGDSPYDSLCDSPISTYRLVSLHQLSDRTKGAFRARQGHRRRDGLQHLEERLIATSRRLVAA